MNLRIIKKSTSDRYVLSVDIGTTSTKGILVNEQGLSVAETSIIHFENHLHEGQHEQDAEVVWWTEFSQVVRSLISTAKVVSSSIKCICVTGMFPCFCPTDECGKPLHAALLYDDNRALKYAATLKENNNALIEGNELIARIKWFKDSFPDESSRLQRVFSAHNFIVFHLTGRYCVDGHTALLFGDVFDPLGYKWNREELDRNNVDEDLLPEILPPSTIAGFVLPRAALHMGLETGTPVLVGTGDIVASLLGSGVQETGDVMLHYGSTGALLRLSHDIKFILTAASYPDGDDGIEWCAALPRSGKRLEWLRSILALEPSSEANFMIPNERISTESANQARNTSLFLFDTGLPRKYGTVTPPLASIVGIPLGTTPIELYKSAQEGFAYFLRLRAETSGLLEKSGLWFTSGGGTGDVSLCQIVSDVLNVEQIVLRESNTSFGGALIAGEAVELFDRQAVIKQKIASAIRFQPNRKIHDYYTEQYQLYSSAMDSLQSFRDHSIRESV